MTALPKTKIHSHHSLPPSGFPQTSQARDRVFNTFNNQNWLPAPILKRFLAFVVDCIIVGVLTKILNVFVFAKLIPFAPIRSIMIGLCITSLYWTLLTLEMGATPGKKALGLRIIHCDGGLHLNFRQLFFRETIGRLVSSFFLAGYLSSFLNPERKTWHDYLAKTRVVQYR